MIKAIKKLFSVDESELDFDEIETSEEKSLLYKKSLDEQFEKTNTGDLNFDEIFSEHGNKIREVPDDNIQSVFEIESIPTEPSIPAFDETTPDVLVHDIVEEEIKPSSRSFDFAQEIDDAYEKPYTLFKEEVKESKPEVKVEISEEESMKDENKKDQLVSKDTYVLKDIISPMHGVIRKETNIIKRDEEVKKSQIIKLREQVKTTEIEPDTTDNYAETLEFQFTDTKDLDDTLNSMPSGTPRDTLSETSKFTLIEDSTGEMKLVIDEE